MLLVVCLKESGRSSTVVSAVSRADTQAVNQMEKKRAMLTKTSRAANTRCSASSAILAFIIRARKLLKNTIMHPCFINALPDIARY